MTLVFNDLQDDANPLNGSQVESSDKLGELIEDLQCRLPFMFELEGTNGVKLSIGVAGSVGCVQHSRIDGDSAYLLAVRPGERALTSDKTPYAVDEGREHSIEFLVGDTGTPVPPRYLLPITLTKEISIYFLQTGERFQNVLWDEI